MKELTLLLSIMLIVSMFSSVAADAAAPQGISHSNMMPVDKIANHGSTMVELPDGTLFSVWFNGNGERDGNLTKLIGSRSKDGGTTWTEPFVVYDTWDFPDNNPVLFVDSQQRLWLFYGVIYNGQWVSTQTKFMYADMGNYEYAARNGGNAKWHYPQPLYTNVGEGMFGEGKYVNGQWTYGIKGAEIKFVNPNSVTAATYLDPSQYVPVTTRFGGATRYITDSFVVQMRNKYEAYVAYLKSAKPYDDVYAGRTDEIITMLTTGVSVKEPSIMKNSIERSSGADNDVNTWGPIYRRLGWQTKNKPIEVTLADGVTKRLILPLYSDSLANSVCAYTDDHGITWKFSDPIVGSGTIQGSLIQKQDGTIRGYFRSGKLDGRNGRMAWHTTYSESADYGATWSVPKVDPYLKNDGGFELSKLPNGDWLLASNQETSRSAVKPKQDGNRNSFSLLLSSDEGLTWKPIMVKDGMNNGESYEYPSVVVDRAGNALMNYTYKMPASGGEDRTIGFSRIASSEIGMLFDSVLTATYGAGSSLSMDSVTMLPSMELKVGDTSQLTYNLTVGGQSSYASVDTLTLTSDMPAVAVTNPATGIVQAMAPGTAMITAVSNRYGTICKFIVKVTQ
ncbi:MULTISPECIES: exo-alpha-sialidase [unclassified Paenibacillus]|uniref:exo-alpha-sialidase n=1 Tax=unclassified Paenibacillus TaxID=185978 RepID=UPI0023794B7C|nr:exo-alpha-sialidase [Paenibacillus sp. MAHUQ-63]